MPTPFFGGGRPGLALRFTDFGRPCFFFLSVARRGCAVRAFAAGRADAAGRAAAFFPAAAAGRRAVAAGRRGVRAGRPGMFLLWARQREGGEATE
tara:strand:+ start:494 stop:778 length:285 start_codon:yes stop_codon:yes gene_type:complete